MRHAPLKQRKLPPYGSWQRLFAADVCGQVGQKRRRRAARGEDQLVLCARHAHIKEPALLFRIRVRRDERRRIAVQKGAPPSLPSPPTKSARAQGTTFTRKKRRVPLLTSPHRMRTGARDHIHPQKTQGSSAPFPEQNAHGRKVCPSPYRMRKAPRGISARRPLCFPARAPSPRLFQI